MSKISKSVVTTIIAIALGAPVVAAAGEELHGASVKVSYSDLNLQETQGAETLYRRLQAASKAACDVRSLAAEGSVRAFAEAKGCYRDTLDAAVAEVDNQNVSRIHAG